MRKRTIKCLFDNIFWYTLYALPILLLLLNWFRGGQISLSEVFSTAGFNIISNNIIFDALVKLFGSSSTILPIFSNTIILEFLTYFIMLMIIHIVIDVILFIPRYCHKILEKGEQK